MTSWPSAKMSASAATTSPTTRFAAKRPSSTAGATFSMMTLRRPSNSTTTPVSGASLIPDSAEQLSRERTDHHGQDAPRGAVTQSSQPHDLLDSDRHRHENRREGTEARPMLQRGDPRGHTRH